MMNCARKYAIRRGSGTPSKLFLKETRSGTISTERCSLMFRSTTFHRPAISAFRRRVAQCNTATSALSRNRVKWTMPADKAGSLSVEDNLSLVSYLLQTNGLPAGPEDLKAG